MIKPIEECKEKLSNNILILAKSSLKITLSIMNFTSDCPWKLIDNSQIKNNFVYHHHEFEKLLQDDYFYVPIKLTKAQSLDLILSGANRYREIERLIQSKQYPWNIFYQVKDEEIRKELE